MKIVIFLIFFFFFILPASLFFLLIYKGVKNTKKDVWVGEVIDKLYNQKKESDSPRVHQFYTVVVKTDKGETRKLAVSKEEYDKWQIGDKAKKEEGKLNVVRV